MTEPARKVRAVAAHLAAGALAVGLAASAAAEDVAVIVLNEAYRDVRDADTGIDPGRLAGALDDAGFSVERIEDARAAALQSRLFGLRTRMEEADRLVVVIAGHVVTNGRDSWLLGTDAGRVSAFDAGAEGLPLSVLDPYLAEKPGSALLLVASPASEAAGTGLALGYLPGEVAQGVTVLAGPGEELAEILVEDILGAGLPVGRALAARAGGGVAGYGFLPRLAGFLPTETATDRGAADRAAWQAAEAEDSAAAYEAYLARFGQGLFADEARQRLGELSLSPEARAARDEAALGLDRETRREVQRYLTLLGYDTRGIDGIFGRGTRAALRDWQADEGLEATGYATAEQVALLRRMGGARQADLEAEAERRQAEADRADRAFWQETGADGTAAGLSRYLERHPDGRYAETARRRLAALEDERQAAAGTADRRAWEEARDRDTAAGYETYLAVHPEGAFAAEARTRLLELRAEPEDDDGLDAARAEEARILVNPITRLLVERRLEQLGLEPGNADGTFDAETRKAIRNYQRARDLPVTGFVSQATLVRLLAG